MTFDSNPGFAIRKCNDLPYVATNLKTMFFSCFWNIFNLNKEQLNTYLTQSITT
jgi:hypothetical protein